MTLLLYGTVAEFAVAVGDQNSPERVYFGTEYRHPDVSKVIIPMEAIAGFFFVLIALAFVGLGQVMGRYFDMIPKRLQAYTTNIVGSLVGIIAFALISYLWLSPFWWFLIGLGCSCYFLDGTLKRRILNISIAVVTICLIGFLGWGIGLDKIGNFISPDLGKRLASEEVLWSPYYRVVHNTVTHDIAVNNIGHQTMISVGEKGPAYSLPYLLNRDSGRPFIDDVLIIGAGSGNDVSAALMAGVKHIDAVEIDPVIMHLGEKHHPNNPYADERVKLHSNDGRKSLKTSDRKYDLVIYALVDSLVLHSGYSNIRLESFLFTKEAFEDIKARLKVNGIFVMYNFYRQGWIVGRLRNLAKDVFEKEPIVISIPYLSEINDSIMKGGGYTMILVGDTEKISNAFESNGSYWIPKSDYMTQSAKTGFAKFPS